MRNYKTILIVDDDPIARGIFRTYFTQRGAEHVVEAENGVHALKVLDESEQEIELIQLDIYMPLMDGIEVMRHLRDREYSGDIAIVSGAKLADRANATELAALYNLNVVGEVKKPLTKKSLEALFNPQVPAFPNTGLEGNGTAA
ncbi:MAG: response regulator [Alphaproteobacteria bacterium]|nr:response regulator [Alphaproteobacteria bacterium]